VPLESLLAHPPDLLVLASHIDEYRTAVADNLRHPALRRLRERNASLELPWRHWLCGTPHIADAIERLAQARAGIEARAR
jgi:iron complex transport system substrate-binding protein